METTETGTESLPKVVTKSRRHIWWNWIRARLPLLLLLGLLIAPLLPKWDWVGIPFILLGQGLRSWAVGYIHKDRSLATSGPYSLCRNPLYLGSFLSGIGISVLVGNWLVAAIFTLVFAFVYIPTIRQEEGYLTQVYGEEYLAYSAKVPSFFPRLRRVQVGEPQSWTWRQLIKNEEHLTWIAMALFVVLMVVKQRCF